MDNVLLTSVILPVPHNVPVALSCGLAQLLPKVDCVFTFVAVRVLAAGKLGPAVQSARHRWLCEV